MAEVLDEVIRVYMTDLADYRGPNPTIQRVSGRSGLYGSNKVRFDHLHNIY